MSSYHRNQLSKVNLQVGNADLEFGQNTSAASLPVVLASDQTYTEVNVADIYSGLSFPLPAGSSSNSIDTRYVKSLAFFGNVTWDGGTNHELKVQVSQDNSTWFDSLSSFFANSGQDFYDSVVMPARYIRLHHAQGAMNSGSASCVGKF